MYYSTNNSTNIKELKQNNIQFYKGSSTSMDKMIIIERLMGYNQDQVKKLLELMEISEVKSNKNNELIVDTERFRVSDSITLFRQRSKTKYWHAIITANVNGKKEQYRRSTSKQDFIEAQEEAMKIKFQIEGAIYYGANITTSKALFKNIAKEVIKDYDAIIKEEKVKNSRKRPTSLNYKSYLTKYAIPYFENYQVASIDLVDVENYLDSLDNKSKSTITQHKTMLSHVFKKAVKTRQMKHQDMLDVYKAEVKMEEAEQLREAFTEHDLKAIRSNTDRFVKAGKKAVTRHYREAFFHYFNFLLETGMRPGEEPCGIKFGDIEKRIDKDTKEEYYTIKVRKGKTQSKAKYRTIAISNKATNYIEKAATVLLNVNLSIDELIKKYSDHEVFYSYVYKAKPTFNDIIKHLIEYLGDKINNKKYVLYCCRVSYINKKIEDGVSLNAIAEHCGNSVSIIEKYYKRYKVMCNKPSHIINE